MKILLVEDEIKVRSYLEEYLRKSAFSVESCSSLEELETYLLVKQFLDPDLIILDRLLGGQDAGEFIPRIKEHLPNTKILILSAIGSTHEKAKFLDIGADDYLSKPFSIEELGARLRALNRRGGGKDEKVIMKGNISLHLLNQHVIIEGKKIDLSRKEFLLLQTFMEHPGRVFNKFALLDRVWDSGPEIESNVVEVTIRNLRKKLEYAGAKGNIASRRNVGYWFEA